ncbi:ATP-dependent DNA helicase RecG [Streptococcus sp. X16XC17]|uniref:ATP-dependent DNA helicase RecG n=1 Tax=unclassified Streptococcus TaxID=2608887 RepID=UPI00066FFAFD|nr:MULTISPECIES: ATP-dependent DNA helicase RecG [unclassified Streptococcus]TCD46742.1 ATP-dependent DNA helicase RecG [Streptococcus sp. X16XC17]
MKMLNDKISVLPGVWAKSAEKFLRLGLESVEDVLVYYPFRYEDFQAKSVFELVDGEKAMITGEVVTPANVQYYGSKRNRLRFSIKQGENVISVSFFNQPYLADKIQIGQEIAIWGKWDATKVALTGMKILAQNDEDLQPIYHVAQGISQTSVIKLIKSAFSQGYLDLIEENIPQVLLDKYHLLERKSAIAAMHFPKNLEEYRQALRRIKFEELFYFQMDLQMVKSSNRVVSSGIAISFDEVKLKEEIAKLPFELTEAQFSSLAEILADMKSGAHMNRLLQGDVGSGKTVVAGLAMYAAFTAGFQSALMVPTEILAEQHFESLSTLFPDLSIALLTGGMKAAVRKTALAAIENGQVDMIIGTHALIQDAVPYHKLGLVITDEQHRFGVNQRRILREKGENPDVLMMTATPIPRTLAITAFGEMDVSIINQLPAGRKPIITRWVKHEQMPVVLEWMDKELVGGAQVYFISPLIEESEVLDLKNAVALEEELAEYFAGRAQVALLHGKMKNDEKEAIMQKFKDGRTDILVSTTVIEVGVNVPNATIMVIMNADRFGLSQLHQLRGRVGRGHKQSYAVLVANPKTESGKNRMKIMTETTDGFVLAEEDLKMRGSGEIFGTKQSGLPEFQVANIVEDFAIVEEARRMAAEITADPHWSNDSRWAILVKNMNEKGNLD